MIEFLGGLFLGALIGFFIGIQPTISIPAHAKADEIIRRYQK